MRKANVAATIFRERNIWKREKFYYIIQYFAVVRGVVLRMASSGRFGKRS